MMYKLLTTAQILVFVLFLMVPVNGQDEVTLPDSVMRQIVRSVYEMNSGVMNSAPVQRGKTIYIAERNIRVEWLPKIRNIDFVVVPNDEMIRSKRKYHLFTPPTQLATGLYEIRFGYGDFCSASGSTRAFAFRAGASSTWNFLCLGIGLWQLVELQSA